MRVKFGDSIANEVFRAHDDLTHAQLEKAGGLQSKSLGDGFMALFSSANQAIGAAVSIQRAIEEHNASNPEVPIAVRMGLNSGDVTQRDGDVHGTAVHAAARIASKAQGGQILIAQIVNDLAGSLSETRIVDRGLFWLKGFPERWRLSEVLWREKGGRPERASREVRAASAAAFDLDRPRAESPVVGRNAEQRVIQEHLAAASSGGLNAVVLEGEAGIGKTRMLEATAEMAAESDPPFWVLDVSADEELRGPFLLFRSLLTSHRMTAVAREAMALEQLDRAQDAIGGRGSTADENLSPQEQMLRTFDEVTSAVSALTKERPLALLLDDLQWADEDSIQLIRYLVRTLPSAPIFLLINIRPYTDSASGGTGKLVADLDRMRVTQVVRMDRLTRVQTGELLENILGSPVDDSTLQSLHSRSEGVPFFIEEFARAYREADALHLIDGTWTMTRLSGPEVPSSVQSLIERRLAQLTEECRSLLADAGSLGRRFGLDDLSQVLARLTGEKPVPVWQLGEDLQSAIDLGLITEEPEGSVYDFSFSHDQIRTSLQDSNSRQRQRAIHGAIAEALAAEGGPESLSMLAYHSLKAGDEQTAVTAGLDAARAAMEVSAPEESIRLIDATLPAASEPEDRIEMLRVKDDALGLLDRGMDRMANLAEMTALTGAVSSPGLETEVKLRRASAARAMEDFENAAKLAKEVRATAEEEGNPHLELEACLELGQALTRSPIGEGYFPLMELDLDAADEPFSRALEVARELGARSEEAGALRELSVLEAGRMRRAAAEAKEEGATIYDLLQAGPTMFAGAKELAEQAFHIYEDLGDRRGSMSALISMAYAHITDPTARGMAGRIEHIRTLHNSREGQVTDSQRANDDALMLYSIHAYAREFFQPDLALERGRQAFEAARSIGDRWLESLAAGGVAMTYVSFGASDDASAWLDRAATAAMAVASSAMARRLEMWRGACAASRAEVGLMQDHFEKAAELAGNKSLAGRAQAYCALAIESAKLGVQLEDLQLIEQARSAANETLDCIRPMSGQLPWEGVAHAVLAVAADTNGDADEAAEEARTALSMVDLETFPNHAVDAVWGAGRTLLHQEAPEAEELAQEITQGLGFINMTISDPDIKTQWFEVPSHRELAEMTGFEPFAIWEGPDPPDIDLDEPEMDLLRDLASGSKTAIAGANAEKDDLDKEISSLLSKLGVESEAEAIKYAIKAGVAWQ